LAEIPYLVLCVYKPFHGFLRNLGRGFTETIEENDINLAAELGRRFVQELNNLL
jgi:hypothetical protein